MTTNSPIRSTVFNKVRPVIVSTVFLFVAFFYVWSIGMSNWKEAVLDEVSGRHIVPASAGCYAIKMLYQNRGYARVVYIGTSKNLKKRLSNHDVIHIIEAVTPFAIVLKYKTIESNVDRRVLELKLIDRLQPVVNKDGK